jgi:hypothetical protein
MNDNELVMTDAVLKYMIAALHAQPGTDYSGLTFDELRAAYSIIPAPKVSMIQFAERMEMDIEPRDENGLTAEQLACNDAGIHFFQSLAKVGGPAEVHFNEVEAEEDAA